MNIINNLKFKYKIGIIVVVSTICLIVAGITSFFYLSESNKMLDDMYDNQLIPVRTVEEIQNNVTSGNLLAIRIITEKNHDKQLKLKDELAGFSGDTSKLFNSLNSFKTDEETEQFIKNVLEDRETYKAERAKVLDIAYSGNNDEAMNQYMKTVEPLVKKYRNDCDKLTEIYMNKAKAANEHADTIKDTANKVVLGINIFALLALILLSLFITNNINKVINEMINICKDLAEGNFSKDIIANTKDEIGILKKELSIVQKELKDILMNVFDSSEQVASSSEELTATSEQSAVAIQSVAESITHTAELTNNQNDIVENTYIETNKLNEKIIKINKQLADMMNDCKDAITSTENGNTSLVEVNDKMNVIHKSVTNTENAINELNIKTKSVGDIINDIQSIAEQTNLLALNAAIEAAHAGEHGKGFSVVADEVRKLAEESKQSAEKVSMTIKDIQTDMSKVISAMHINVASVQSGISTMKSANDSINDINNRINTVDDSAKNISIIMKEILNTSNNIDALVKDVQTKANNVAADTQTISASAEEQSASMEEIAAASHSLATLATNLQNVLTKFKV